MNVLTLIAAKPDAAALETWLRDAARALEKLGAHPDRPVWLAKGQAADIAFDELDPDQAEAAVRSTLGLGRDGPHVDAVAQPAEGRRKQLLVSDMESTVIANEMLNEIADIVGIGPQIAEITRRAMNNELDFAGSLRARIALLKGKPASLLDEAAKRITLMPGAKALVATMVKHGATTALVSGGFTFFTGPIAKSLGFHQHHANVLEVADSSIAGVAEPILTRESKLETLTKLAADGGLSLDQTIAVGDGANDLSMLGAAGLGIAYHAQPNVTAQARHCIDHADLTALLYAQGYRQDEIVEAC